MESYSMMYIAPASRVIHKGLIGPNGETGSLCFEPIRAIDPESEYAILSKWLHDEITCAACLAKLGLETKISRGQLLRDNLAVRLYMTFDMVDANYWNRNVRQSNEDKINPDPDGWMASEFLRLTKEFDELMKPLITAMEKHEGLFGWPDVVNGWTRKN